MIGRIIVNVKDTRKFQDIVLLVDRKDFRDDLQLLKELMSKELNQYTMYADLWTKATYFERARSIIHKYKYPNGFINAISIAALTGKINDIDVKNCYTAILMHPMSVLGTYSPILTKDDFVFHVSSKNIHGNIDKITAEFKNTLETVANGIKPLPKNHPLTLDIRPDIDKHREWYWRKKENGRGESAKIAQQYNTEIESVDTATSRYKKLLKTYI